LSSLFISNASLWLFLYIGYMADINIIDHDNLCVYKPEMVHDLPTGSRRIMQKAGGYIATIKSGVVTFKNDEATGELPGTLIRGARDE